MSQCATFFLGIQKFLPQQPKLLDHCTEVPFCKSFPLKSGITVTFSVAGLYIFAGSFRHNAATLGSLHLPEGSRRWLPVWAGPQWGPLQSLGHEASFFFRGFLNPSNDTDFLISFCEHQRMQPLIDQCTTTKSHRKWIFPRCFRVWKSVWSAAAGRDAGGVRAAARLQLRRWSCQS